MYASTYGLEYISPDWTHPEPIDRDWDMIVRNHGFAAAYSWGGTESIRQSLIHDTTNCVQTGAGGEIFRHYMVPVKVSNLNEYGSYFTPHYHDTDLANAVEPDYEPAILRGLFQECERLGINPQAADNDALYPIDLLHQSQVAYHIPCMTHQLKYMYVPLLEYNVVRNRVPYSSSSGSKFQLAIIKYLCPSILDIPIFSAGRNKIINSETLDLCESDTNAEKLNHSDFALWLRKISPKQVIKNVYRPIKHLLLQRDRQKIDVPKLHAFAYPDEHLLQEKYVIPSKEFYSSNNAFHWVMLHRILRQLGF